MLEDLDRMSLASMLTDATSLTMTPTLIPSVFSNKFLSVDVLPLPKNPLNNVMGTFSSAVVASVMEEEAENNGGKCNTALVFVSLVQDDDNGVGRDNDVVLGTTVNPPTIQT